MDVGIIVAIVMLFGWAVAALVLQGPGWVHLFLTIYRIVVRGSPKDPVSRAPDRK
jgi:hypothetical protein